jgi:hypothetical protein
MLCQPALPTFTVASVAQLVPSVDDSTLTFAPYALAQSSDTRPIENALPRSTRHHSRSFDLDAQLVVDKPSTAFAAALPLSELDALARLA